MRIVEDPTLGRLTYPDGTPDAAIYADIDRRLMSLLEPKPKTSAFGQVREVVKGVFPGIGGFAESAAKGIGGYYADLAKSYGIGPGAEPVVKGIGELGQQVAESPVGEFFAPREGYEVAPKLGRALGSIAGIAAFAPLGPRAMFGAGAAAGTGEQLERAVESGAGLEQRRISALLGGATGLTEAIPIEMAFTRAMKLMPGSIMNQGLQVIRNAAITGGVEGAQEAAQNYLQNLIARGIYKPDQELIEGVGEGAAYGAGAGAILQAALDLTYGRRAMRQRTREEAPPEEAEVVGTGEAPPSAEEQAVTRREAIRAKQLEQGINIIDEGDLEALGIPKGKKADNTYAKLLGKNLSDPDQFAQVEKVIGEYLSGARQKFNDISTIEKVLDKQIAGEPLNLFEELVVRNYSGEDVDAYLMGRLQELRGRAPVTERAAEAAAAAKPKTAKEIAAEQAAIARREVAERQAQQAQQEKEAKAADKAAGASARELKKLGLTPIVPPTAEEGAMAFSEAQPDLFGEITTQGPEVTRGSSEEAAFQRQRAEFENTLQQLDVAAQASVAGVPDADAVVRATSNRIADDIQRLPFSLGELIDIRNRIVRQGTQVPGSEVLMRVLNDRIITEVSQGEAVEGQMELPFAETIQGELFEPAGPVSALPEAGVEAEVEGLTREGLKALGIASNKISQYEGKNLTDEGVAEGIRADLTNRATNFRRELNKAKSEYAAILGPEGVMKGKKTRAAELEKRIANLEQSFAAAQENLRMFPALEQGQLTFDALQPVESEVFPTATQQEEEKRFRKIRADEAAVEAGLEEGVASELETRMPTSRTVQDVEDLIGRIKPLRGKINSGKATPEQQADYDQNLFTLFSMVRGPGRIQLRFDTTDPASLAFNRAFAKAEGFLKNLSRKERSRLAKKIVGMRGRDVERETVTRVLGKQARREAEQFTEDGARTEARQERERRAQEEKSKERKAQQQPTKNEVTRAAASAVMKITPEEAFRDQSDVQDLRQAVRDSYDDASNTVDFAYLARAYDLKTDKLEEAYNLELDRLRGVDVETKRVKEEEARIEEARREKALKDKEQAEASAKEEQLRTKTLREIKGMEAQPLAELIRNVEKLEGTDFQPVMRNIARTGKVAENLQTKIDLPFDEGKPESRKLTAKELEESEGKLTKRISRTPKVNKWVPFDTAYQYAILRSGDNKFAIIAPARYNVRDLLGSFKVQYPDSVVDELGSGTLANVKYLSFTASNVPEGTRPMAEPGVVTPQAGAQQRLAEQQAAKKIAAVTETLTNSTYENLKNGKAVKEAVDKHGMDATFRALADLRAQRADMREKTGNFAMDDRVLNDALDYLNKTYGVQVYFSTREVQAEEEPNVGYANELLNKTSKGGYNVTELLKTISKHERNSETGRLARVLLTNANKFKLDDIPVVYNPLDSGRSYYAGFYDQSNNRFATISIGKAHLYMPDVGLHEIVHALSVEQMRKVSDPTYKRTGDSWEQAADGLNNLHSYMEFFVADASTNESLRKSTSLTENDIKKLRSHYGMTNSFEFVSEAISDEEFKTLLKKIPSKTFINFLTYTIGKGPVEFEEFRNKTRKEVNDRLNYVAEDIFSSVQERALAKRIIKEWFDQPEGGGKRLLSIGQKYEDSGIKNAYEIAEILKRSIDNWFYGRKSITQNKDVVSKQLSIFQRLVRGTKNAFEMFTKLLRQALGLPSSSQSVFDIVINQFGTLIEETPTSAVTRGSPRNLIVTQKATTPKKYGRDPLPDDVIKLLDSIKNNPALDVPVIKSGADAALAVKTGALPFLAMNQIRDIYGSDPRLAELKDYYTATQKMGGYRNKLRKEFGDVLNDFHKVIRDHRGLKDKIYEVINEGSRLEVDVLKPSKDYTDPAAKADHKRLQDIYNTFPQDVKNFYQKYRKHNDYMLDQIKESMIARATSYVTDPASKAEIRALINKKIDSFKDKGPYAPLMFFGNNWVVAGKDDKATPFSFETKAQADSFAKGMKAQGYEVKQFESIQELKAKSAPRAGFFKQLEGVLDRNRINPKAKDEIYQMTLMYLPEESFMRQFQNRKGAPSYERDALRNYGELADRIVHQLPKARYTSEMDQAIETMKAKIKQNPDDVAGRVLGEVEKHFDSAMNPVISPWATRLGNLGFAWYMGANPSSALVQLLQTPGVTLPWLAPRYGLNPTMTELTRAGRDFFGGEVSGGQGFYSVTTNKNLSALEKKAIQELYDLNVIPPAATEVGDIETMTGLKASTPMERTGKKINFLVGYLFQNAERFNREVTALAAFRLEYNRSKNYDKAMQAANDAVVETQGDYSDLNAPRVFKRPVAKVLLMFKKFLQMMLYLYARNAQIYMQKNKFSDEERRIARNRLAGLLGTSAMMSGVVGMPFFWMVEFIMNNVFDDEDDPYYDFVTSLRETMPEFITAGIPGALTGANIASRTGFRDMPLLGFFPGVGAGASRSEDSEGAIMDALKAATGPVGSMFLNVAKGSDQINDGQVYRGIETMLPSVIKNFMKSYRFVDEGARTLRGDPIMEEVSGYDAALQAFGFAPLEVATKQEKANAVMKIQTEAQRSKQKVYMLVNLAVSSGDEEGYDDALKLVAKHNAKYPGMEITDDQLTRSIENFAKRSSEMIDGVYVEKSLRPFLAPMVE